VKVTAAPVCLAAAQPLLDPFESASLPAAARDGRPIRA
jgi:hypothetical protein